MATALITGASSGIGAAFARQLAQKGFDLILTGRRLQQLELLKTEIQQIYPVQVELIIAELTREEDLLGIETQIKACNDLTLLINNAGYGTRDLFMQTPLQKHLDMIKVHDMASLRFIHAALPGMLKRKQGSVINVASMLSFMSQEYTVNYSATKAFLVTLSRVLNREFKKKNIHIQALCPGLTRTDFFQREELKETEIYEKIPAWLWMNPEKVAIVSLAALSTRKCIVVPGWINRFYHLCLDFMTFFSHLRFYVKKRVW